MAFTQGDKPPAEENVNHDTEAYAQVIIIKFTVSVTVAIDGYD